jgi:hypothetical protein
MSSEFIASLKSVVDGEWGRIKQGAFARRVLGHTVTPGLYRDLMVQIYHYTRHNSTNQAATSFVEAPEGLLRFVYRHAAEELGHERMVLHDLRSVGLLDEAQLLEAPLPATEALIGYLWAVSLRYGPVPRLGYSFWAEGSYEHIGDMLAKIKSDLSIPKQSMTFFGSHIELDVNHMEQVSEALSKYAETGAQQELVRTVARTTLYLTGQLLEQVAARHPAGQA